MFNKSPLQFQPSCHRAHPKSHNKSWINLLFVHFLSEHSVHFVASSLLFEVTLWVPVCHSQMGERRQVFKSSFWNQRYVVAMEGPGKTRDTRWGRIVFGLEYTPGESARRFLAWVVINSQQTERLESVERPHRDAAQAVVAQDALHTKRTCWHGDTMKSFGNLQNAR